MQANEHVDVIIYRVRDNGLEVFLVNDNDGADPNGHWMTPSTPDNQPNSLLLAANCIELDPIEGSTRKAIAIEADWHELPSLRALLYEDYRVAKQKAKQKIRNILPFMEKGSFVAVKEAFKKMMPEQYAYLKELKDILLEKNSTKYV